MKVCKECEDKFTPYHSRQVICQKDECLKKRDSMRSRNYRKRVAKKKSPLFCPDCRGSFMMDSPKAERCNACQKNRESKRRNFLSKLKRHREYYSSHGFEIVEVSTKMICDKEDRSSELWDDIRFDIYQYIRANKMTLDQFAELTGLRDGRQVRSFLFGTKTTKTDAYRAVRDKWLDHKC